jgi:hypothetical protein
MNHASPFVVARVAHERLRRRVAGSSPNETSNRDYSIVKAALDGLWRVAVKFPEGAQAREIIDRLMADAGYFAGLTHTEGFPTAEALSQQYSLLEKALTIEGDT